MSKVVVSKRVNASIQDVWESWNDFGSIYKFNPALSSSHILGNAESPTRVGTKRQCDMADGKNWVREEILDHRAGESMKIEVYDSTMPLKSMVADLEFEKISEDRTRVRFTAEFEPKFGLIGKLMAPMMKRQFQPILQAMLDANADYVENGKEVAMAA